MKSALDLHERHTDVQEKLVHYILDVAPELYDQHRQGLYVEVTYLNKRSLANDFDLIGERRGIFIVIILM